MAVATIRALALLALLIVSGTGCQQTSTGLVPEPDPTIEAKRQSLRERYQSLKQQEWRADAPEEKQRLRVEMDRLWDEYPPAAYDPDQEPGHNLILAAYNDDLKTVHTLLESGADPNTRFRGDVRVFDYISGSRSGTAPFFTPILAMSCREPLPDDIAIAELLLKKGADIDADDGKGGSPLLWAVLSNEPLGMWLIEHGADPHRIGGPYRHGNMMSPLHEACTDAPKLAIAMIDRGASVNHLLYDTPLLSIAARAGELEVVRRLLKAGADPNAIDGGLGSTPLGHAFDGFADVMHSSLLFEDQRHTNAARLAGYPDLIHLLLDAGARTGADEALWTAVVELPFPLGFEAEDRPLPATDALIKIVQRLIAIGGDANQRERLPPPISSLFGVESRHAPVAEPPTLFLAMLQEALISDERPSIRERTRLLALRLTELLLNAGADVHVSNHEGDTPLHLAVWIGEPKLIELLLEHGARMDAKDHDGHTPLMILMDLLPQYRSAAEHFDAARLLVNAGARLAAEDVRQYQQWIEQAAESAAIEQEARSEGDTIEDPTTPFDPRLSALLNSAMADSPRRQ